MNSSSPDTRICYAKIHPAIGVARIGNSTETDGFYIGPEVPHPLPQDAGYYRDSQGALKREVAQFRVYGYNACGEVVRELTCDANTQINWNVELANHKAAWYNFELALDIPEAASAAPSTLRNAKRPREGLSITPGARNITGVNQSGASYHFSGGKFVDIPVDLGELRTDGAGRLQVFGGTGKSASLDGSAPVTFANNDGWYDDTSDGPVTAEVIYNGIALKVAPAWVVVAPPNYAPAQKSVRTLFALITDVHIRAGNLALKRRPSFALDIYPIFKAMSDLQWVNAGFAAGFGDGAPQHFLAEDYLAKLAVNEPCYQELRRTLLNNFRDPARNEVSQSAWPWVYGDAMDVPMPAVPNAMNALTPTQLRYLKQWVDGDFEADLALLEQQPRCLDQVPVAAQPALLDQAALEFCIADAFHPGCEVTWPIRHATLYMEPYRLRHRDPADPEPYYGKVLTSAKALSVNGPLYGQFPGSVTRWMAIPWQTDTASCRSGYDSNYDPYVPTFWPARVPNQVLSAKNFAIVTSKDATYEERLNAFHERADWNRTLGEPAAQLANMITRFGQMGVIAIRDNPHADSPFPAQMQVEDRGGQEHTVEEKAQVRRLQRELISTATR